MLKKVISILCLACLVLLTVTSCGSIEADNPKKPEDIPEANTSPVDLSSDEYEVIAENDNLIFAYNKYTTDIKVTAKKTGYVWTTELQNGDYVVKGDLFTLDYYNTSSSTQQLSCLSDSVEKGQFRAEVLSDGRLRVQYGIGYVNYSIEYPTAISKTRMESFMEKMSGEDYQMVASVYKLIDVNSDAFQAAPVEEQENNKLKYPLAVNDDNEPWYYIGTVNDENSLLLNQIFKRAGYTAEDLEHDNKGVTVTEKERPEFALSIYYKLEANSLVVEVPESEIYHSEDYILENIRLHQNFAQVPGGTDGYFLLPDGSGSIMNFNNGKDAIRTEPVYIPIYGVDSSKYIKEQTSYFNQAIFPVYGIYVNDTGAPTYSEMGYEEELPADETDPDAETPADTEEVPGDTTEPADEETAPAAPTRKGAGKNAMFVIVEDGESFAGIEAHSSNKGLDQYNYNQAWVEFRINEKSDLKAFSSNENSTEVHSMHQFERYKGSLKVRYNFMTGEDTDYSAMAAFYSDYLFGTEQPFGLKDYYTTVEMMGQINAVENFLGIDYDTKEALTTFEQAAAIAKDMKARGMTNMNVKFLGWFNGGYENGYASKMKVQSLLGGSDGLKDLIAALSDEGINLYPDADIQYVYRASGEIKKKDRALALNRRTAHSGEFDIITFTNSRLFSKYTLTMPALTKNLNGFLDKYEKYNNKFISFRSIGKDISSNFDEKEFMERQETMQETLKLIAGVKEKGYQIMGSAGNAPFIQYLDVINEMPIISSGLDKTDYSVPFTSMVLSGYVDYTYEAINLNGSERIDLLRLIEAGAGAHFMVTGQEYEDLTTKTNYGFLYSTYYDKIKDQIFASYDYLAKAQEKTYGERIVKHERLADGVFRTTYQNGVSTIVNYNDTDYKAGGVTVKALDYYVSEGGVDVGR